jgi:putative addiction module component (TIGR02574 family)
MSKAEIIEELPKLSPEDRAEIQARLDELAGPGWLDNGELTEEEKRLLDARLGECERNPSCFVPWEEAMARIMASRKR